MFTKSSDSKNMMNRFFDTLHAAYSKKKKKRILEHQIKLEMNGQTVDKMQPGYTMQIRK